MHFKFVHLQGEGRRANGNKKEKMWWLDFDFAMDDNFVALDQNVITGAKAY